MDALDLFEIISDRDVDGDYETYTDLSRQELRDFLLEYLNRTDVNELLEIVMKTGATFWMYENDAGYYWYVYIQSN
jgi:hypothetical protein